MNTLEIYFGLKLAAIGIVLALTAVALIWRAVDAYKNYRDKRKRRKHDPRRIT